MVAQGQKIARLIGDLRQRDGRNRISRPRIHCPELVYRLCVANSPVPDRRHRVAPGILLPQKSAKKGNAHMLKIPRQA